MMKCTQRNKWHQCVIKERKWNVNSKKKQGSMVMIEFRKPHLEIRHNAQLMLTIYQPIFFNLITSEAAEPSANHLSDLSLRSLTLSFNDTSHFAAPTDIPYAIIHFFNSFTFLENDRAGSVLKPYTSHRSASN